MSIDIKADEQREALNNSIKEFSRFVSYAQESRYAVPGEVDLVIEGLHKVAELMYPETV